MAEADQKLTIRTAENPVLDNCLELRPNLDGMTKEQFEKQPEESKRYTFFVTLPVDIKKTNWSGNNFHEVKKEWQRKLKKLSIDARSQIKQEFEEMCKLNFISKVSELPQHIQKELLNPSETVHAISPAPAFKASSLSTKSRIAFNAGKLRNGYSLNETMPTGRLNLSLQKTIRSFRKNKYWIIGDLRKFYCSVKISEESYKYMLLSTL